MEQFPIRPETSSQLKWARFEPTSERLEIDFKDKDGNYQSTYEYGSDARPFTRQDWENFRAAGRPGEFFAHSIRGKYPYRKLSKKTEPKPEIQQEKLF